MALIRREDWPEQLYAVIDDWRRTPFAWGSADCVCFMAACVEAMTDEDPMAEYRGQYEDEETAKAVMKLMGGGSLYNAMRRKFGKPIHVSMAKRGDLALAKTAMGPTVFVVLGEQMTGPGDDGLEMVPTAGATRAFRVG